MGRRAGRTRRCSPPGGDEAGRRRAGALNTGPPSGVETSRRRGRDAPSEKHETPTGFPVGVSRVEAAGIQGNRQDRRGKATDALPYAPVHDLDLSDDQPGT